MSVNKNNNPNDFPLYLFYQGKNYEAYKFFGVHSKKKGRGKVFVFRVWAPNAVSVSVVGDFNGWDRAANPMYLIADGIWEAEISKLKQFDAYKFSIEAKDGRILMKADPYAAHYETRPGTASKIFESGFEWSDSKWFDEKKNKSIYKSPVNVYEVHLSSWKNYGEEKFLDYVTFAKEIIPYLQKMSYTHVEFMPLTEYPYDGSWGYQVTGYFAPTSRYGTPDDMRKMIDMFHAAGIGVILDWVPAHFPKDEAGLYEFDGTCCYEYTDDRKKEHKAWGTRVFDYGKAEVCSFLISSANYWFDQFHVDGLRVDAVASMLYLDYDRQEGEWAANIYGGNENLEAVEFLKHLNEAVFLKHPDALMIAEESTAWPKITAKPEDGGLGFSFKWNMGWMHDFCEYMKLDPIMRKGDHNGLTFAMSYNSAEKYILPLSHDEVVHLKCSMVNKMPGYKVDKYANLRVGYTFMFGHEGKKLLFMGQEFGQEHEWNEATELEWWRLEEGKDDNYLNIGMKYYMQRLLEIYRSHKCLYEIDDDWSGFEWINADDADRSIYSFFRKCPSQKKALLFVLNMTPMKREGYRVGVPVRKQYKLLLNSTELVFGGAGETSVPEVIKAQKGECDRRDQYIEFDLPAYGAVIFEFSL